MQIRIFTHLPTYKHTCIHTLRLTNMPTYAHIPLHHLFIFFLLPPLGATYVYIQMCIYHACMHTHPPTNILAYYMNTCK